MFNLRYYQSSLIAKVHEVWDQHQAAVIVAATGVGKTLMYLDMAVSDPGRVLVVAHRDYLLQQPIDTLRSVGFEDVAVEKADQRSEGFLNKAKVVFASIQSLCREDRLRTFDPTSFSAVIIDEAHRACATSYRRVIDYFMVNARLRFLLLTATPKRKDNAALGSLCGGDIAVAGTFGPLQASHDGWIVPLKFYRRTVKDLDFSHVALKGTDLDQEQVEQLLMQEGPLHEVCASLAEDRGPTLIFCPGVAVANAYATLMNNRYRPGRAAAMWQDTSQEERTEIGKRLAQGDLDYAFNVDIATEGYDVPALIRVVWAAPTASLVRFTQGTGRVFRPHSSLKHLLDGGPDEAEQRRLLIQQSPKPYGHVVTYYPQNCKHQLCEPNDILGGEELPPMVRKFAKDVQEATAAQPGGSEPEEDVETAKTYVELRNLLEKRRQQIKAKAQVEDTEYDGFGGTRNRMLGDGTDGARGAAKAVSEDWPAGKPVTDKQAWWLKKNGIDPDKLTSWRAVVVRDLMQLGVSKETALSYGKRQALAVLNNMKAKAE